MGEGSAGEESEDRGGGAQGSGRRAQGKKAKTGRKEMERNPAYRQAGLRISICDTLRKPLRKSARNKRTELRVRSQFPSRILSNNGSEILNRPLQPGFQIHFRLPAKPFFRQCNIRPPLLRIILRTWPINKP